MEFGGLFRTKKSKSSPEPRFKHKTKCMAEGRGFEPPVAFTTRPFQDRTLDHSDTLPFIK